MLSRIAYILKIFPKLSETFIAHELVELRRRGLEVLVCSLLPPPPGVRHELITTAGLDTISHYPPEDFCELLQKFKPQLLHAHFATESTAAARDLARQLGLPFTFTAHGYDIRRKPPHDFPERAADAQFVITVSQANANHIAATFGVPASRIRVIPCGVDTDLFCPRLGRENHHLPTIVCVARHVKVKNLSLLLETCAQLCATGLKFRCTLVGDGPFRPELEAATARLGLGEIVQFVGAAEQKQVLGWWQQADLAVLTSDNEGMPVCLMEAAACGLPAVATAVGGVPELIEHGVTGYLTPPASPSELSLRIQELLLDPVRRRSMGIAARARAESVFSLKRQVDALLAAWNEILS